MPAQNLNFAPEFPHNGRFLALNVLYFWKNIFQQEEFSGRLQLIVSPCHDATVDSNVTVIVLTLYYSIHIIIQ